MTIKPDKTTIKKQMSWCASLQLMMRDKLVSFADPALNFGNIKPCTKKEQRGRDVKLFKFDILSYGKTIGRVEMVEVQEKYEGGEIPIDERVQVFNLWLDDYGIEYQPSFVNKSSYYGSSRAANYNDSKDVELTARKFAKFIRKAGFGKPARGGSGK